MTDRWLGNTQNRISAIGYGAMGLSPGVFGQTTDAHSIRTIHHAIDSGVNFFDTAPVYGEGHNETLLGKAIQDRRSNVLIGTKFGLTAMSGASSFDGTPKNARISLESSLARLRTSYVDILYLHRVDPDVPIEESVGEMSKLVADGKVRYLGLSEVNESQLRRANAVDRIDVIQNEYSLFARKAENRMLEMTKSLSMLFVAYGALGHGLLTDTIKSIESLGKRDIRRRISWFEERNLESNLELICGLKEIAADLGISVAQLCLAWILNRNSHVVSLVGTRSCEHLDESLSASDLRLSQEILEKVSLAVPPGAPLGSSIPD